MKGEFEIFKYTVILLINTDPKPFLKCQCIGHRCINALDKDIIWFLSYYPLSVIAHCYAVQHQMEDVEQRMEVFSLTSLVVGSDL